MKSTHTPVTTTIYEILAIPPPQQAAWSLAYITIKTELYQKVYQLYDVGLVTVEREISGDMRVRIPEIDYPVKTLKLVVWMSAGR